MLDQTGNAYDHNESRIKIFLKNHKKRVSKMETQFWQHILCFLNCDLTEHDVIFLVPTLKKKEQKRAIKNDGRFQDFYKQKKILQITFFS